MLGGNSSSCSFTVTVLDNQPPVVTCPVTGNADCNTDSGVCNYTVQGNEFDASVTDNCGATLSYALSGATTGTGTNLGGVVFGEGRTTVTWTAIDGAGNSSSCSFTVTVSDHENPVIHGMPVNQTYTLPLNSCSKNVTWTIPTATDNCGILSLDNDDQDGIDIGTTHVSTLHGAGLHTITYTATDIHGNVHSESFSITLVDAQPPAITGCPGNISVNAENGVCSARVFYVQPQAQDNCGTGATLTINNNAYLSGNVFPVGVTTVIWTATDASGNQATCQFTITVVDNQKPVITNCPAAISHTADAGLCSYNIANLGLPTATDNCGIDHYNGVRSDNLALTGPYPVGTTTITWTAIDLGGNASDPCTQTITISDDEAPVITNMPANQTVSVPSNSCSQLVTWVIPTPTDNCGVQGLVNDDPYSGAIELNGLHITQVSGPGDHVFTYTATDVHGNTHTESFTITLVDDVPPQFTVCPGDISVDADPLTCGAQVFYDLPQANDFGSPATITINNANYASGNIFPVGTTTVIYTATDAAGNSSTCQFTITVADHNKPVVQNCLLDITRTTDGRTTCDQVVNFTPPFATDGCGNVTTDVTVNGVSVGSSIPANTAFPVGTTPIVYTFTDVNGNTSTCSFNIIVVDNTAPQITTAVGSLDITTECENTNDINDAINAVPQAVELRYCDHTSCKRCNHTSLRQHVYKSENLELYRWSW